MAFRNEDELASLLGGAAREFVIGRRLAAPGDDKGAIQFAVKGDCIDDAGYAELMTVEIRHPRR